MAIEAIAIAATQEVAAGAANIEAAQQLAEKVAMQTTENITVSQNMAAVEKSSPAEQFQVGELTSKEIDGKDVLKQKETDAINELGDKLENNTVANSEVSEDELGLTETKEVYRDTGNECVSTYEEQIKQTPREGWAGERGESVCIRETEAFGTVHVKYVNGIPDFSPYSIEVVEITNMSGERFGTGNNFEQADNALAEQFNKDGKDGRSDWTGADVRDWRRENCSDYTWHECTDRKTCQLVPREINGTFGHFGGVGECNKLASLNATDFEYSKPFTGTDLLGLFDN